MSWWLIASAFLAVICGLAAWWWLPKREVERLRPMISDPKARADVEDNLRKSIGQLIGGAAVILGAGLAYYQTQQTLQTQSQHAKDTLQAQDEQSKRTVTSQQVSKGFELLSETENAVKRLGGIYALEGVMNTSEQYHESVIDTLCAFVRFSTEKSATEGPPATDVQAALTVIKRRTAGPGRVVLAHAQIPKAVLNDADLIGADLNGVNLSHAKLLGVKLSGGASLVDAKLIAAELFNANLSGANLVRAKLNGAQPISVDLSDATLIEADLSEVNLNGANLSGAKLNGAILDKADLSDALNLTQGQLDAACGTGTKLPRGLTIKPCQSR
jgi:uncharacterized protein YjbI with pentapeptide repeats